MIASANGFDSSELRCKNRMAAGAASDLLSTGGAVD